MNVHVDLRNVSKEFHGKVALEGVNLSVHYGDFVALVGPNGAGKTTLLRIIDLLEEPSSGEVWLDCVKIDYSRRDLHLIRRDIGFVPQKPILFNASVFDNVAYGLKIRGLKDSEVRMKVKRILELVQLEGFEGKNALRLSGGEMQRVSLAQALVSEPRLLLLDEPTSNLDPRSASIIESILMDINRRGKTTIIMASHNLQEVRGLAKHTAIMRCGKIVRVGQTDEILASLKDDLQEYTRLENIFQGFARPTEHGTSIIEVDGGLKIEAAFTRFGPIRIHIPPESIAILAEKVATSARNIFKGEIFEMTNLGNVINVGVKVESEYEFTIQVTRKSVEEMGLSLGKQVYIAFKASSVKII
ncbi:ABC transporter ATP-binding protein [Candidatus Bathyarchaeota archaeon]|nr:ABC transporter ATP-binding protein [Candidatus Bathyarchaeota archaeon]